MKLDAATECSVAQLVLLAQAHARVQAQSAMLQMRIFHAAFGAVMGGSDGHRAMEKTARELHQQTL
jgi:hypothetical protein